MESPTVIKGIMHMRLFAPRDGGTTTQPSLKAILHEAFCNGTVLLIGRLVIGVITGPTSGEPLKSFMSCLFKGMVLLFLLNVDMLAARRAAKLVEVGPRWVPYGNADHPTRYRAKYRMKTRHIP